MKFSNHCHSSRGISMMFVLAALIITALIGGAMIKLVSGDQMANALYYTSSTARSAAQSGVIAAIQVIESADPNTTIIPRLQRWINAAKTNSAVSDADRWLVGTAASNGYQALGNLKFRSKMIAFDSKKFNVTIQSEGIGNGGARAVETAVYHIDGLKYNQTLGSMPSNALQMDNGAFEFNLHLIVDGNTSLKDTMTINGPVDFLGTYRLDSIVTSTGTRRARGITVNGPAVYDSIVYSAGSISGFGDVKFKNNMGLNGRFKYDPDDVTFGKTGRTYSYYFAGGFLGTSGAALDLDNNNLYAYNTGTTHSYEEGYYAAWDKKQMAAFSNYISSPKSFETGTAQIPTAVGFAQNEPDPKIFFNTSIIDNFAFDINSVSELNAMPSTAETLNSYYDNNPSKLWNGFLVIRINNFTVSDWKSPFTKTAGSFQRKAIIINNNPRVIFRSFYESGNTGITALYIDKNISNEDFFANVVKFRGLMYINDASSAQYFSIKTTRNSTFEGAIYGSERSKLHFNSNGGSGSGLNTNTIDYESGVLTPLWDLGLFSNPSAAENTTLLLKSSYTNLIADVISQSM